MKNTFTSYRTLNARGLPGLLLGVCLWLVSTLLAAAQTVYVTPQGAGGQTGADWANALPATLLQAQLATAPEGTVFRLAGGLYKPTTTADRTLSFLIPSGVQVYGGYLGSGPTPDQRMEVANPDQPSSTTLSGDIDQDNRLDEDNTDHVVVFTHAAQQTRLDGVVITGGYASQANYPPYNPGGPSYSSPGGAGIYNNTFGGDSSPTIENCWLIGNHTQGNGGALLTDLQGGSTQLKLTNTQFIDNTASGGGAIYTLVVNGHSVDARLTNCRFLANSAQRGGAVFTEFSAEFRGVGSVTPAFVNCSFEGNRAAERGGAFFTTAFSSASLRVQSNLINCTLVDNTAPLGGAFFNTGGPSMARTVQLYVGASLTNSIVWNNGGATAVVNEDYRQPPGVTSFERGFVTSTNGLLEAGLLLTSGTANQVATSSPFSGPASLQLAPCSPAIDAGLTSAYTQANGPATDLAGHARIFPADGPIDMGAVESHHPASQLLAITRQPASQSSVVVGSTVETTVGLNAPADSYAWYKDGSLVAGQTSATLRLTHVELAQSGSYSLVATSACNSVTSTAFSLSVTQPQPPAQQLAQLWLINADNNQPIQQLTQGLTIDLSQLPSRRINVQARTEPATVGSVVFQLSGQQTHQQVETLAPYALFGDDNKGNYLPWTPVAGSYQLTATPYTSAGGTGTAGTSLSVSFTVVDPANSQRLAQLVLINADTDQPIQQLTNGQQLDLSKLPTQHLAVQAVTDPTTVGSVVFALSGQQTHQQVETIAPYALFGDNQGHYSSWTPALGSYTLTATPYSGAGGTGSMGTALSVSFTVIESATPAPQRLAQLVLINADTDQPIQQLTNGQQLDLSKLPTKHLAVQAVTDPITVGSVVFALSGQQSRQQVETIAPYALFGDDQGDFLSWTPALGTYTLSATPYSSVGGTGVAGTPLTVSFTVINPAAARQAAVSMEAAEQDRWQVRVLGNPVVGSEVVVEVSGAQNQALEYSLTMAGGMVVDRRQAVSREAVERQRLQVGSGGGGVLLLQVSTPTRRQTLKVLKSQ